MDAPRSRKEEARVVVGSDQTPRREDLLGELCEMHILDEGELQAELAHTQKPDPEARTRIRHRRSALSDLRRWVTSVWVPEPRSPAARS